ncbi:hypothetical protein [Streptomyces tagetis]|uniref:Polymerase nucleotidyl transferase domain-containing protein n=1 Tax=Streptomyces tagetis TaxID=2820809 RepID=A0A940XIF8_9ACTN|nr:hypothetical protein [Streptomyces sp. RG38]MBQ0825155.1 hypothetical protein [Streptomyces sp. RG38]
MAGSLSVGLGTETSDVDLFVFVDEVTGGRKHPVREGIRVDIEQITVRDIRELARGFRSFTATGTDRTQTTLDEDTLKLVVRTRLGSVLKPGAPVDEIRRDLVPDVLRKVLMTRNLVDLGAFVEDAYGALRIDDLPTAYCASGIALDMAADALLAACGDVYVSEKLRLRKLIREPRLTAFTRHYWQTRHAGVPADADPARLRELIHARLWLIGGIGCACVLSYWDGEPEGEVPVPVVGGPGPTRNPFLVPVRYADGCGLTRPNSAFDVSEDALGLWSLLDGRPVDAVVGALAGKAGVVAGDEVRQEIRAALEQFREMGLLYSGFADV